MNKGYITITLQSKDDLTEFLQATQELIAGILQYSEGIESTVISGRIEPSKYIGDGTVSQFWIDYLNGVPLKPEVAAIFSEKDFAVES